MRIIPSRRVAKRDQRSQAVGSSLNSRGRRPIRPALRKTTSPDQRDRTHSKNMSKPCIFCKIIQGEIPSFKLYESNRVLSFLDINPLSRGHALVIPKFHGEKLSDIPDEYLTEILPVVKRIAKATEAEDWNVLQNNGRIAHQEVNHVHFHMIPKPNSAEGLGIHWPQQQTDMEKLKQLCAEINSAIET